MEPLDHIMGGPKSALDAIVEKYTRDKDRVLRPFDKEDWYAFAGCEDPNPQIWTDRLTTLIVTLTTVEVSFYAEDLNEEPITYQADFHTRDGAIEVANLILSRRGPDFTKIVRALLGRIN